MYRNILISMSLFSCPFLLLGCGHYGPLYYPENAALHEHHPKKSKIPSTAATAKQTEEYKNIDQLTIPDIIQEATEENNGA